MKIYRPTDVDSQRCLSIRKRSKRGHYSSPEDTKLCYKLATRYPEWYKETEPIVFNETVPYGSNAHKDVNQSALDAMLIKESST